ncbi:MAG: dTMP kinase [Candidatus Zixiibacteriota bacterium]|nr:MAG: dTMP kinase [candidate division Zixibacteria bacterium]
MNSKGFFITFEGIDGCGKTTQLELADNFLTASGRETLVIREPGSTPLSERIRDILLDNSLSVNPVSELMLYIAARAELVNNAIIPAIAAGKVVLCDRFYDSTTAYQGYGRGIDVTLISQLHRLTVGSHSPDLTFLIDVDYETSLSRRKLTADRLESESEEFFGKVRDGFVKIAEAEPERVVVIDGGKTIESIFAEVRHWLETRLKI